MHLVVKSLYARRLLGEPLPDSRGLRALSKTLQLVSGKAKGVGITEKQGKLLDGLVANDFLKCVVETPELRGSLRMDLHY